MSTSSISVASSSSLTSSSTGKAQEQSKPSLLTGLVNDPWLMNRIAELFQLIGKVTTSSSSSEKGTEIHLSQTIASLDRADVYLDFIQWNYEFVIQGNIFSSLLMAIYSQDIKEIYALLEFDDQILKVRDKKGRTALHWAALLGDLEIIRLLVKQKMSPSARDYDGNNAIHLAATRGNYKIVDYLLRVDRFNGSTAINMRNLSLMTPLDVAESYRIIYPLQGMLCFSIIAQMLTNYGGKRGVENGKMMKTKKELS